MRYPAAGVLALVVASVCAGEGQAPGVRFRDFSGACQGNPSGPLWDHALGWDRHDLAWDRCEPERGEWNQEYVDAYGTRVLEARERGIRVLPTLDYNAGWSWDRGPRTYEYRKARRQVVPREDGKYDVVKYRRNAEGVWQFVEPTMSDGGVMFPLAEEHVADWEQYVRRVVSFLSAPPYEVEYFEIWNEAHPLSGFWEGGLDEYMTRVHLPAAKVIRELGGKVVYGGFPCCGSLAELLALLDKHDAWKTVDVLCVHYFGLATMEGLRAAAAERGFPEMGVWQTEVGFNANYSYISNYYPRALHWALSNGWNERDRYKLFYFAFWSPDDPKAYGYGKCLNSSDTLSEHGRSLQTLGELLDGSGLAVYPHVSSSPALEPVAKETSPGLEAFTVDDRIVIAVHCVSDKEPFPEELVLTLPEVDGSSVAKVERCTALGESEDITSAVRAREGQPGIELAVKTRVEGDVESSEWWGFTGTVRTFYVVVIQRRE